MDAPLISVLLRSFDGGGAERVAINLANGFGERGFRVDFVVQYRRGPYMPLIDESIEIVELGTRVRYAVPQMVSYLRDRRPAAMLSLMTEANLLAALSWRVARMPGNLVLCEQNSLTSVHGLRVRFARRLYPWATYVVAVSAAMREQLVELGVADEKALFIPNPLASELSASDMYTSRHVPNGLPSLVAVGRLAVQKDFGTLISAFHVVRQKREARLLILGEGPEKESLQALVRDLDLVDSVTFGGFVSPPWEMMSESSALVMSSRWEGWPGVLVEAMALGVPVVSTDCPTGPAEILDHGRLGPLVPVGDADALAGAIMGVLDDPVAPQDLRARALEWSVPNIVPKYLSALGMESHP